MIYVELRIFPGNKAYDLKVDEMALIRDILEELELYIDIRAKTSELVSVREELILLKNETLNQQGVRGGDTLVILKDVMNGDLHDNQGGLQADRQETL